MKNKCSSCKRTDCNSTSPCENMGKSEQITNVIAVMSGKGGVGKSTITSLLAVALADRGYQVGILDADITGPSIPRLFGLEGSRAKNTKEGIFPVNSRNGIRIMSLNLLLQGEEEPVIWRGPVLAGTVKQFWEKVRWGELDYLLVDLPPGTGDVPLTVMQSLPLKGIVMVSSPQSLVTMIVGKGIKMAERMNTRILGLVENMSYIECPDCGKKIKLFGESNLEEICHSKELEFLAQLPINMQFVTLCDAGQIEEGYSEIRSIREQIDEAVAKITSSD